MSTDKWYEKLQTSTTVPFDGDIFSSDNDANANGQSLVYALELFRLEFKQLPDANDFLFSLCFFDFQTRRFGGSQLVQNCSSRNSKIQLDQHLLFRTLASKNAMIIVAELADRQRNALCWTAIPLGGVSEQMEPPPPQSTVSAAGPSVQSQLRKSFPLYAGSCRVLLLAHGLNQLEPHLRKLDAILSIRLRLSSTPIGRQFPAFHFLPAEQVESFEGLPKFTALLDNIRLNFSSGGQKAADSFLLNLLAREYCYALNRKWNPGEPPSGLRVLERRLKIGAHDGHGFLDKPICVLLEPMNTFVDVQAPAKQVRQRSRSLGRLDDGQGADFGVRQSVRLRALPVQPELAIVFQLDYLLGCPLGNGQDLLANARLIRVAWTAWCPCSDGELNQADTVSLQLLGGPRPAPAPFGLCLRDLSVLPVVMATGQWPPMPPQRVRMDLHFNFVPLTEGDDGMPKGLSRLSLQQTPLPRPDRVPEEVARPPSAPLATQSRPIPSIIQTEPEEMPLSMGTGRREATEETLLWPLAVDVSPTGQPSTALLAIEEQHSAGLSASAIHVELPLGRVHPLPRSMIGLMAKFPAISAVEGPAPKPVDVQSRRELDLAVETAERRWPSSELSIQFLAFLPAQAGFPRAQTPPRLFFSFQLHRFEPVVTECLFAEPPDNVGTGPQPMLLWREGGQQPGLTTRFVVGAEQQEDLATYLLGHQLHLHVWEADSLFHLGTASIPLKFLLRQGSPAVQCSLQCQVFQAGFPPAWCPSQGPSLNGLLFLRLANVGLPAARTTFPSRPNPKRVKSLRSGQQTPLERFLAMQRLDMAQRSARLFGPEEEKRIREWQQLKAGEKGGPELIVPRNEGGGAQKFIFAEELAAYKALRREGKALALLRAVFSSITTQMSVRITLGQLHLFPLQVRNPLAEEFVCELDSNDARLSPIFSPLELKQLRHQQGAMPNRLEEPVWQQANGAQNRGTWRFGLRPMEKLDLPMRFEPGLDERQCQDGQQECRVFVRRLPSGHPLAILELSVQVQRPSLAQHLRWHTEECRKLVRTVALAKPAQCLRCSDPTVHCQLQEGGRLVRVECQTGESPQFREFLLFLYGTHLPIQLEGIWRISIHALGRLHAETVQGQPVRVPLPVPASLASAVPEGDLIRLHCSPPPPSLRFHPGPAFPAHFGLQPAILLSLGQLGRFHVLVNAVRASAQQPIGQWLLSLVVGQPNVTKVFQVIVPSQVQQIVHKRIPLDNPLSIPRQFRLSSSDAGLLSVPTPSPPPIAPNSTLPVQLDIHPPASRPAQCQALLFVQDAQTGSQEEAFQLNIRFH